MPASLRILLFASGLSVIACAVPGQAPDERPARPGEWGFHPAPDATAETDPPAFVWRPQPGATGYEWQVARDAAFTESVLTRATRYPVCCPDTVLGEGRWCWRFRVAARSGGEPGGWSTVRWFTIAPGTVELPMPDRAEIARRVPKGHPRLFVRPDDLPRLRKLARDELRKPFDSLVRRCERLVAEPPPTAEPPKYPAGVQRKSEEWREIWWGNRRYTIAVLQSAADLAFAGRIGRRADFVAAGRRLLLAAARWDPKGATGYRYNDEAGMPYAYWFARAYTFLHEDLDEAERELCREVMRVRGREMYGHLAPRHLWRPWSSHSNRARHFLGELGVAFHDEIPEAAEWLFFATRVFAAVYPVWSDTDGGWHEGMAYWRSYLDRFTWWADVMKAAIGVDAYDKPFFSRVGDFALYLQPPGTGGGGFGDLAGRQTSRHQAAIMARFARATGNPYWQWYAEAHPDRSAEAGFIGFLRAAQSAPEARPPDDLPASKLFRGRVMGFLNTELREARDNVEVIFKSSPFGSQSHGYEAQNSFLLYAFGERLLIRSGQRDMYGSAHHSKWMWSTRSTNCITADGKGQGVHTAAAKGRITAFATGRTFDYVAGEAGDACEHVDGFERRILFAKPDWIVVHDVLRGDRPRVFTFWLHSLEPMQLGEREVTVTKGEAACVVRFLDPAGLALEQTDRFDPPPRPRVQLVQHHLTATTGQPAREVEFVTVIRPLRADRLGKAEGSVRLERNQPGRRLVLEGVGEPVTVDLRSDGLTARRGDTAFDSRQAVLR